MRYNSTTAWECEGHNEKILYLVHIIASSAMIAGGIGAFVLRVLGWIEIPFLCAHQMRNLNLEKKIGTKK